MINNILLVDDDLDDILLFHEALNEVNSQINFHSAISGQKALEFLMTQTTSPDLIFLDINMPEMNGWRCLTELKNTSFLKQIPVVMYTTSANTMEELKALDLGAAGFYQKPEVFEEIKDLLKTVIKDFT